MTNTEPFEQWLGLYNEQKLEENRKIMAEHGMELRSKVLFAALNIELVANVVRNLEIGRTAKDGLKKWSFNDNIDYLFSKGLLDKQAEERFHAFRHIRNAFIHEIECKTTDDLARLEPRPIPLMLELADKALKAVPLPLVRTTTQRLDLGLNIIGNSVIAECGRMVEDQAKKRAKT